MWFQILVPVLLLPLLAGAEQPKQTLSSASISEETREARRSGDHVLTFWWLPVEYWTASARELKKSAKQVDQAHELLQRYVVLAMVDARVYSDGRLAYRNMEGVRDSLRLTRGSREIPPLSRLDPEVARILPELAYFLSAGLGVMSGGLRLVLFPNIDDEGEPIASGSANRRIDARYEPEGDALISLVWHAPLTSVVGPGLCPRGGEALEASWAYCPYHGVPVE